MSGPLENLMPWVDPFVARPKRFPDFATTYHIRSSQSTKSVPEIVLEDEIDPSTHFDERYQRITPNLNLTQWHWDCQAEPLGNWMNLTFTMVFTAFCQIANATCGHLWYLFHHGLGRSDGHGTGHLSHQSAMMKSNGRIIQSSLQFQTYVSNYV